MSAAFELKAWISKLSKAIGDKGTGEKPTRNKNHRNEWKAFAVKRYKARQIFTYCLLPTFPPCASSGSASLLSPRALLAISLPFSMEKLAIFYPLCTMRLGEGKENLILEFIKIKFQFKNVQLLEFVFLSYIIIRSIIISWKQSIWGRNCSVCNCLRPRMVG